MPPEYWADEIKHLKNDPPARLEMALANRPYPAAYGEAAIALRAMIREQRTKGEDPSDLLEQLYSVGMEAEYMQGPEDAETGPFAIAEIIPRSDADQLTFPYNEFGHELALFFNATDRKWFEEAWGEPEANRPPIEADRELWERHRKRLPEVEEERMRTAMERAFGPEGRRKRPAVPAQRSTPAAPAKDTSGCLVILAIPALFALLASCGTDRPQTEVAHDLAPALEDAYVIARGARVADE